jgi:FHS family L-fucose permease-like MFS transporter
MVHLNQKQTFYLLTSIFFIWGVIGGLNDVLVPHLKHVFELSYTQAVMVQFVFFTGYLLVSIPASKVINQKGLSYGLLCGLLLIAVGGLLFTPATIKLSYPLFLLALFVIAAGITFLQVSANTYVTTLGKADTASSRLNLSQGFQSIGAFLAPILGGYFILTTLAPTTGYSEATAITAVQSFYAVISFLLLIFWLIVRKINLKQPDIHSQEQEITAKGTFDLLFKSKKLSYGAIAIFLYIGAEVSIGSFLINFLLEHSQHKFSQEKAAYFASLYFMGMIIGRFAGAWLMKIIKAKDMVKVLALCAVILSLITSFADGKIAMYTVLLIGLCNSIMFPTIFTLAIAGLGKFATKGAGILCVAIFGGAIIPLCQGSVADVFGLQISFIIPALCFVFIFIYAHKYSNL